MKYMKIGGHRKLRPKFFSSKKFDKLCQYFFIIKSSWIPAKKNQKTNLKKKKKISDKMQKNSYKYLYEICLYV